MVHLAAQPDVPLAFGSPRYTVMQNIEGTVALLEAVRESSCVSRLMFAGSGNEIGRAAYLPIDEDHPADSSQPVRVLESSGGNGIGGVASGLRHPLSSLEDRGW